MAKLSETEKATESLKALVQLSGLDVALFTPLKEGGEADAAESLEVIYSTDGCQHSCPRCAHLPKDEYWGVQCRKTHLAAGMLADRYGGKYVYICPENKLFVSAPLVENRRVRAVAILGPVDVVEEEEDPTVYVGYAPFKQCDVETFHNVTELLAAVAAYNSGSEPSYLRRVGQMDQDARSRMTDSIIAGTGKKVMREYPISSENDMVAAIKEGNPVSALAAYDKLYGAFTSYGMTRGDHMAYERLADLVVVITRAGLDAGANTEIVFTAGERCREELKYVSTGLQVYHRIRFLIEEITGYVQALRNLNYDRNIYRIQTYVYTHYAEDISLENMAAEIGYSPAYLSRVFKEKTGSNLFSFVNKVRIEAAMADLRNSDCTVSEVAKRCGFESAGYFTRIFKKMTGMTPGYYRSHGGKSK